MESVIIQLRIILFMKRYHFKLPFSKESSPLKNTGGWDFFGFILASDETVLLAESSFSPQLHVPFQACDSVLPQFCLFQYILVPPRKYFIISRFIAVSSQLFFPLTHILNTGHRHTKFATIFIFASRKARVFCLTQRWQSRLLIQIFNYVLN